MSVFDPWAAPPLVEPGGPWTFAARVVSVYDGDTVTVDCLVDVGFEELVTKRRRSGLLGVDTPELNASDPVKRAAAVAARDYVRSILPPGKAVTVRVVGFDKYGGRDDGDLVVDGAQLAAILIERGLGVPYSGGARN